MLIIATSTFIKINAYSKYVMIAFMFLLLTLTTTKHAVSQANVDSINQVVTNTTSDSIKVESLLKLLVSSNDPQEAIKYGNDAIKIANENNYSEFLSRVYTQMGIVYYGVGDYEKTLNFFFDALTILEDRQDTSALARCYNNIGLILVDLGRTDETIKYLKLSLEMKQQIGDEEGVANSYSNLGLAYQEIDSLNTAYHYFKLAQAIDERLENTYGIYIAFSNLGKNHFKRSQYDSAEYYYNNAIMMSDQINNRLYKSELLKDYGDLNAARKEYNRAIEKYNTSLMIAYEIGAKLLIQQCFEGLSAVYKSVDDLDKALMYYIKYDSINELLFNEQQTQKIAEIEGNYKIQKSEKEIELLRKESEIKDLRIKNNTTLLYFLLFAILLIVLLVILQYRKNIYKTKTNLILKNKNDEIIDKNKNIMDSILYAKNIQKAILPSGKKLKQIFSDAFVHSKPRDIVNGDFYWFTEKGDKVIIAAVDCTGHGVPAAFLNVMGNSHLNDIVIEQNILEPAKILQELNRKVLSSLNSNKMSAHTNDGMDISLCLFDRSSYKLYFAGAKRPIYYFHNGELCVVKGDSIPVGGYAYENQRSYTQHELSLNKNDSIYLFTDGIVDQFGGTNNKKFMYPRLRKLLEQVHAQPMTDQLDTIKEHLEEWRGNNEQTDDILIIGVMV